jgi:AraC-like DNA-binding protein
VRRELAIDRLRRTDRPVKQIAREAGFGNEKSFARAFRQWTGESPSAFRRS